MRTWPSLLLLLSTNALGDCGFKAHIQKVYSLSGPVSTALKEYGLIKDPKVRGLSVFYPAPREYTGERLPGGVFLAPEKKAALGGSTLFFDESQELRRLFPPTMSSIQAIEIKTRGQVPLETATMITKELHLVLEGCEKEEKNYLEKTKSLMETVSTLARKLPPVVFFLGEFKGGRPPELVMANDGVVKFLRGTGAIKTYPSELAYVHWSAKVMNSFPKKTLKVAFKDSGAAHERKIVRHSVTDMTVIYPGALIPGPDQLEAWRYWLENAY